MWRLWKCSCISLSWWTTHSHLETKQTELFFPEYFVWEGMSAAGLILAARLHWKFCTFCISWARDTSPGPSLRPGLHPSCWWRLDRRQGFYFTSTSITKYQKNEDFSFQFTGEDSCAMQIWDFFHINHESFCMLDIYWYFMRNGSYRTEQENTI